ncbi:MAG: deoxyhypusine synthase [Planctomycetota bacterium]
MTTVPENWQQRAIEHVSLDAFNPVPLVDAMEGMAFQARNLARAAKIYERMLRDQECSVWLCLAGSLVSAGLKQVFLDLIRSNMVDAIVSTGANIVDQDVFEALGFQHWHGDVTADDNELRDKEIDRIYDTYIDESELRIVDDTMRDISDRLEPRPHSSREFLIETGRFLSDNAKNRDSIVLECYERKIPIFCPAFSDCSAGFGMVEHQYKKQLKGEPSMSLDSAKDFLELTRVKMEGGASGLFMIGGGVPKNFAQDTVVAADILGVEAEMHRYAIQLSVADERDGALSGSTLKEASSWGKVSTQAEQMVWGEATITLPLVAGYAFHKKASEGRKERRFNDLLETPTQPTV